MTELALPQPVGQRGVFERWAARASLLRRSPKLALPLALRSAVEGAIRLTPNGSRTFFDPADFAWTHDMEAGYGAVQEELDRVLEQWEAIPRFQDLQPEQERLTQDDRWKTYVLYGYGRWCERNRQECPETARLLEGIPGLRAAMFSILAPGKHLPPHRGPYAGVLRYHLGLRVPAPERCAIRVGGDVRHWEEGKSLLFDDSHDHEAWNGSDGVRVVLFVDLVRPLPQPLAAINGLVLNAMGKSAFVQRAHDALDRWYADRAQTAARVAREPGLAA